jgi:stage II sporulation protein D
MRDHEVHVVLDDMAFYAMSLQVVPKRDAALTLEVIDGIQPPEPRSYRGTLQVDVDPDGPTALRLFNDVSLDEYVAAVVSREYGFDDLEGAKAMAVLARTYALYQMQHGKGKSLSDQVLSQKYDGAERLTRAAREATRQTQGEVLTYRGDLIEAVYFSSSGGHTADNEAVWNGTALPYLRGVPDPYDTASPHALWRTTIPRDQLLRILSDTYHFRVEGFHLGDPSRDGRIRTIELLKSNRTEQVIPSNEFRLLVNQHFGALELKSTLFDARRNGNTYVFEGRGFGHGVGLSQYGALAMSKQRHSYRDILAFYFTDVDLQQWESGVSIPLVAQTDPPLNNSKFPPLPKPKPKPEEKETSRKRVGW